MLEFQNVSVKEENRAVLNDLSLLIPEGVIMGLAGSDDAAKSCLLSVAAGVQAPESGQVILDEELVSYEEKSETFSDHMGYMPQDYGFYDLLRTEEYFELFLSLHRVNPRYWEKRSDAILKLIGLEEYRDVFINEIPPDLRPLLCLGKTLLHDPDWLFLDNPFSGLSGAGRDQMIRALLALQEEGKSIVINSRMFPALLDFYTDITVIEEGQVVISGLIQDVYDRAMAQSPVRMHVIAGMDEALEVLKRNKLVERVVVNEMDVIFRFTGGEKEEAELLSDLVSAGALIQNYMRNQVNIEQIFKGGI